MNGLQACLFKYITDAAFRIYGQLDEDASGGSVLNSHGHYITQSWKIVEK